MTTVRIAQFADTHLLAAVNRLLPQLSSSAAPLSANDLEGIVTSDATTLFVAVDGDEVVGMLTLVVFTIPSGVRAWIEDVVVDESRRGTGVGEALTLAAVGHARGRDARSIELTSRPSREAANALYRKLGFVARETNVYRLLLEG